MTAIMQAGALVWDYKFHDWNESIDVSDIQLKDQYNFGTIQQQQIGANRISMRNAINSINGNVLHSLPNGMSIGHDAQMLQNQIALIQQQQQQKMLHNALTRTSSHQPTNSELQLLQSNLDALSSPTECHRKLERTQSEPAQVNSQVNTSRYKTELCRPFKETGECKYGEKCQFAHGENELRTVQRHPKYKTEYCRTFYGVGLCPYGSRCHFLHDLSGEDDNTRPRNTNRNDSAIQNARQFLNKDDTSNRMTSHAFARNIDDAMPKATRFIATPKDDAIPIVNRPFGRNATILNGNAIGVNHPLPMSPPLSMSTGSDRASPICSLSPTNSIASFPFTDQNSTFNMNNVNANVLYSSHITPPASPPAILAATPPSTPILINKINSLNGMSNEKPRLPIFNQISCAIDTLKNLPL